MDTLYWTLFGLIALASFLVSSLVERRFKKYSEVSLPLTGKEVAEKMLRENGLTDVKVTCTKGHLTDHYNPATKTVNLSESVYGSANVAAAAVAAHECGHAVQHEREYAPLSMRSALVPAVTFTSKWMMWVILAGMLLLDVFPQLLWAGIALYAVTTLFTFVTLPVEIDASRRAIAWLEEAGVTNGETKSMAVSALRSAAYTYVVAALASLANLVYYILVASGRSRN